MDLEPLVALPLFLVKYGWELYLAALPEGVSPIVGAAVAMAGIWVGVKILRILALLAGILAGVALIHMSGSFPSLW